jgi:hypothetical protein
MALRPVHNIYVFLSFSGLTDKGRTQAQEDSNMMHKANACVIGPRSPRHTRCQLVVIRIMCSPSISAPNESTSSASCSLAVPSRYRSWCTHPPRPDSEAFEKTRVLSLTGTTLPPSPRSCLHALQQTSSGGMHCVQPPSHATRTLPATCEVSNQQSCRRMHSWHLSLSGR